MDDVFYACTKLKVNFETERVMIFHARERFPSWWLDRNRVGLALGIVNNKTDAYEIDVTLFFTLKNWPLSLVAVSHKL